MRRTRACRSALCDVLEASSESDPAVDLARDFSGEALGVTKSPGEDRRDRGVATGDCDGRLLCAGLTMGLRVFFMTGTSSSSSLLIVVAATGALNSASVVALLAASRSFICSYAASASSSSGCGKEVPFA